jgi:mannose-6-phosphate isomerase-like protein (cupin superfamily)
MNTTTEKIAYEPSNPKVQVITPSEGRPYWMVGDLETIKLSSKETNGALAWLESFVVPKGGPPPHIHHHEDELFYVLSGELTFYAGDKTVPVQAGTLVYIPKGTLHYFKNTSSSNARMIAVFVGGGVEDFFAEVGVAAAIDSTVAAPFTEKRKEQFLKIAPKYGIEVLV